jgi:putative toxin-antitoxin system antitoxin component (TIGR02293 family)
LANALNLSKIDPAQARVETAAGGDLLQFDGRSVEKLRDHGFSMDEIHRFVAPRRTLARRIEKGEPLTLAENDSAHRLLRISELADRVFGTRERAQGWLRKPSRVLHGVVPLDLLESETGARLVEEEILRIDHGIYM